MLIHSLTPYYVLHTVTATDANTLTNTIVPYSGKFLRGSIFRGFCRELLPRKKEPVKFWTRAFKNILHFVPEVKQLSKKRQQDLTMSICRYLRPVNSLPQPDGSLSSSLPPVAIKQKRGSRLQHTKEMENRNLRETDAWTATSNCEVCCPTR